jgi:hypothetical protein
MQLVDSIILACFPLFLNHSNRPQSFSIQINHSILETLQPPHQFQYPTHVTDMQALTGGESPEASRIALL